MPQTALDSAARSAPETALPGRSALVCLAAITPVVLLVHGYHPFADDAAIYVAGIRKLLDPSLYQPDAPFVLANTHLSLFAHLMAAAIRATHLRLSVVLFATYLVSIFGFLLACWLIACRLFEGAARRWSAVAVAAACFTLPAAGTAITLMDPYVTSRSFSTPLGLFAIAAVLERRWTLSAMLVLLAELMHPLMGIYVAAFVLFYALFRCGHPRVAASLGVAAVAVAGLFAFLTRHAYVSPAYIQAVHSQIRSFLFPRQWHWYEDLGLAAPLALYALLARPSAPGRIRALCLACLTLGLSCTAAAFLCIHSTGPYLLVRLQPLRAFHTLYLLGALLLGGWLGGLLGHNPRARWLLCILFAIAAAGMFATQRATYPLSAHIEWPGVSPRNPWSQAYLWIRTNTPANAVFAADPGLISMEGVDMQGFRATAERSLLADDKDQGVAAVMDPSIATLWALQRNAQVGIDRMDDAERVARLKPLGVTWLLLPANAATGFACPYRNAAAEVCRMPG
jgi:hypothetical protein